MILGLGGKTPAAKTTSANKPQEAAASDGVIFDVNTEGFEQAVIMSSMETPILVDFWAPWCGPCKQLMPVLEAVVKEAGGKVRLAKVNIDDNQELAQALRIQSVPTVYAFFKGQPVTAFTGVRPVSEIKAIIGQLSKMAAGEKPDAIDIPAALKAAAEALAQNDPQTAQAIYAQVIDQDENNVQAYVGIVRTMIAMDLLDEAGQMIEHAPEPIAKDAQFAAARTALDLARNKPDRKAQEKFAKALAQNPDDHQARYDLAVALFAGGEKEQAMDELVQIIRRNRSWEEDKARKKLLEFFEALGPSDPLTLAGRRKLSTVLFS